MKLKKCFLFTGSAFALALIAAEPAVDRYGQYIGENWPGKISSDAELRAAAEKERAELNEIRLDPAQADRFGGKPEAGKFSATGRFHTRKIDGRWWLISPAGHRYFVIGCDAVGCMERGYFTPTLNPDGSARAVFAEGLPSEAEFPDSYIGSGVNFLAANLRRKYGPDFVRKSAEINRRRLLAWGFNSTAKWGWGATFGLPYIEDLSFRNIKRFSRKRVDVYDPGFPAEAEKQILEQIARRRNDPMLIAYATENEKGWNIHDVKKLASGPDIASRRELKKFLTDRYGEEKAEQLLNSGIPEQDCRDFIRVASAYYHKLLRDIYKKHAPDQLWFGSSNCDSQSCEWIYAAAPYTDAIMFNEYDLYGKWIHSMLPVLEKLDRPIFISEFSFVGDRRGMRSFKRTNTMHGDRARGLGYRHYTEMIAALRLCIGFGYFLFYDQPVTMRRLPQGECHNFGLVDGTDQPYEEMIAEVKKSNARLEDVHAGKIPPYRLEEPRKYFSRLAVERLWGEELQPESFSLNLSVDTARPEHFGGCKVRAKIYDWNIHDLRNPLPKIHSAGIMKAPEGKYYAGVTADLYFWSRLKNQNLNHYYELQISSDGKNFTSVPVDFSPVRKLEFDHWLLRNAEPFPAGTKYLQLLLKVPEAKRCWVNQLAGIHTVLLP